METTDKIKEKVGRWKTQLDELNVQLHLGMSESRDSFEELKSSMKEWTIETKQKIGEKSADVKASLEELELALALGKAETADKLKEQQELINKKINNLKEKMQESGKSSEERVDEIAEKVKDHLESYKSKFELLKMKLSLGKADASDVWEKEKKEISAKIQDLKAKLDKEVNEERWNNFSSEMKESWKHLQDAFKKK